jgi:hypothetical protein
MKIQKSLLALAIAAFCVHSAVGAASLAAVKPGKAATAGTLNVPAISGATLNSDWAQMTYSIPSAVHPVLDQTGAHCEVGQRGDIWYLHGTFGNGPVTRECTVPAGKPLAFPVMNITVFDTPGHCQEGSMTDEKMRAIAAQEMDAVEIVAVTLDGEHLNNVVRLRSNIFPLYVPTDNVFSPYCEGGYPRATYRAYDEGFYSQIDGLSEGAHTLKFYGRSSNGFEVHATYILSAKRVVH